MYAEKERVLEEEQGKTNLRGRGSVWMYEYMNFDDAKEESNKAASKDKHCFKINTRLLQQTKPCFKIH